MARKEVRKLVRMKYSELKKEIKNIFYGHAHSRVGISPIQLNNELVNIGIFPTLLEIQRVLILFMQKRIIVQTHIDSPLRCRYKIYEGLVDK
jgi:hypothetical protein